MVRDIGQILALLQQQSSLRGTGVGDWSPATEQPTQQQTLDVHKPVFMENSRSSCSLPTVAESRAELRADCRQPTKGLSTQRSLDSASR